MNKFVQLDQYFINVDAIDYIGNDTKGNGYIAFRNGEKIGFQVSASQLMSQIARRP